MIFCEQCGHWHGNSHGAHSTSHFEVNHWNTTSLTLNVMERVARQANLNISNDVVADQLYQICADLESWPTDEGFGSSDSYSYLKRAEQEVTS